VKVTETSKICSLDEKTSVVSCSFFPKKSLLACGLDNGKWCLFKDDSTCSPFSDWAANLYGSPETTGSSALCIDWDVIIYENIIFCLVFNIFPISFLDIELPLVLVMEL